MGLMGRKAHPSIGVVMDPVLAQALATLISAMATAVLLAASYYWGPRQRDKRRQEEEDGE